MEELKPCPFCGCEARIAVCDSEGNVHDWAYGDGPYSGMSYGIVHGLGDYSGECPIASDGPLPWLYDTRDEAVAAWNRRAERTCHPVLEDETLVCSECGEDIDGYGWNYCPNCGAKVVDE